MKNKKNVFIKINDGKIVINCMSGYKFYMELVKEMEINFA